jgi:hypothetical protein
VAVKWFLGEANLSQEEIYVGKIFSNVSKTSIRVFLGALSILSKYFQKLKF